MINRCFKCMKPIPEGEIVCDNKWCIESLKDFNKAIKKNKVENYKKFEPVKKELSELEEIVEKTIVEKEDGKDNKSESNRL